jgi:integrase
LALKLGYYAGFRTHELVHPDNLQIKALKKLLPKQKSWTPKSINLPVKGKGSKGGKLRIVRIEVPLVEALYKFLWGRAKHITTSLMSSPKGVPLKDINYGTYLFKQCINSFLAKSKENIDWSREDFEIWDQKTYHQLRACFATNAVKLCREHGWDVRTNVTQWMGHNHYSTTEIYIFYDAVLNQLPEVIASLSLVNTTAGKRYR